MALQVFRTGAAEYGQWIKTLVCGEPGKGKTRFGRSWPNPFYANAEGGLMSIAHDHLPFTNITKSTDLQELLSRLKQAPEVRAKMLGVPVETVIIDTFDEVARMLVRERLVEQKKESMSQPDWGWLGDQLRGILREFRNLDMHVIFACHVTAKQDGDEGPVYVQPAIQGAVGGEIAAFVDLALLFDARPMVKVVDGESQRIVVRFARTYPDPRFPWIKDRSGKMPMEFELDFETDFERIHKMIFGGVPSAGEELVVKEAEAVVNEAPPPPPAANTTKKAAGATKKAAAKKADEPKETPEAEQPKLDAETPTDEKPQDEFEVGDAEKPIDPPKPPAGVDSATGEITGDAVKAPAESVPAAGTNGTGEAPPCQQCGGAIDPPMQREISQIRFREDLCRPCFMNRKKAEVAK